MDPYRSEVQVCAEAATRSLGQFLQLVEPFRLLFGFFCLRSLLFRFFSRLTDE
jgi:hypothetical protein